MLYNSKGKKLIIGSSEMHYVTFGYGEKELIIILGLGDGLRSVKGQSLVLASFYKEYAKSFRVYVFGRKEVIPNDYSIKDMAKDQVTAMELLGIQSAVVMGVSQGGMIAQQMAIDFPQVVEKLVIGVSVSRNNETLNSVVNRWIAMAQAGNYRALLDDTMKKTYTHSKYKQLKFWVPLVSLIGRPKSFDRFIIQAKACLNHHVYDQLHQIVCPALVIGGDQDEVAGLNSSEEMADKIDNCQRVIYKGLGHGAYEEAKDFNQRVIAFLTN